MLRQAALAFGEAPGTAPPQRTLGGGAGGADIRSNHSDIEDSEGSDASLYYLESEPAADMEPTERCDLVKATFCALDLDGDGVLDLREMLPFAELTGFEGSEADWRRAYADLCAEYGLPGAVSVDLGAFSRLVDDTSELSGCYCSEYDLRAMLGRLQEHGARPTPVEGEARGRAPRAAQPEAEQQDPALTLWDGLELQGASGGPTGDPAPAASGSRAEPVAREPRHAEGADPWDRGTASRPAWVPPGPTPAGAPGGATSSDAAPGPRQSAGDLPLGSPPRGTSHPSRAGLVAAVFRALDRDRDGVLNMMEMQRFAELTGFDGGSDEWAQTYRFLCLDSGLAEGGTVDLVTFEALVNDRSEDAGCFCSDAELRDIVRDLVRQLSRQAGPGLAPCPPPAAPAAAGDGMGPRAGPGLARPELLAAAFRGLDADGDGLLDQREMRQFAEHVGTSGPTTIKARQ